MRSFPIFPLHLFGPTPETTMSDGRCPVLREVLVDVNTVLALVEHVAHFMRVTRCSCLTFNLSGEVCRGDISLTDGHVAHLWSGEVHAVAGGVNSLVAHHAHARVNLDESFIVGDSQVLCG